ITGSNATRFTDPLQVHREEARATDARVRLTARMYRDDRPMVTGKLSLPINCIRRGTEELLRDRRPLPCGLRGPGGPRPRWSHCRGIDPGARAAARRSSPRCDSDLHRMMLRDCPATPMPKLPPSFPSCSETQPRPADLGDVLEPQPPRSGSR